MLCLHYPLHLLCDRLQGFGNGHGSNNRRLDVLPNDVFNVWIAGKLGDQVVWDFSEVREMMVPFWMIATEIHAQTETVRGGNHPFVRIERVVDRTAEKGR